MASTTTTLASNDKIMTGSQSSVSTETSVRRRIRLRVDALSHFGVPFLTPQIHEQSAHLREVACYLTWLNLIGCSIADATEECFWNSERYPYLHRLKTLLPPNVLDLAEALKEKIYESETKERIMSLIEQMSVIEMMAYIRDCRVSRFYFDMLTNQARLVQDLRTLSSRSESADPVMQRIRKSVKLYLRGSLSTDTQQLYFRYATAHEHRLAFMLDILRALRRSTGIASQSSQLPSELVAEIGRRLHRFDQGSIYSQACSLVSYTSPEEPQLVYESECWWTPPSTLQGDRTGDGKRVVSAYPAGTKPRSTLNFFIPAILLASVIPAAIAWKFDESTPGTTRDPNFWQAVAGSVLQLLSLVTFIWPILGSPRLLPLTWFCIWVLAGVSVVCATISVPLYLKYPTILSFGVSFAGMLAQAIMQLQVINVIQS